MSHTVYAVYVVDVNTQDETLVDFFTSSTLAVKACPGISRQYNTGMVSEESSAAAYKTIVRATTESIALSQLGV